MRSIPPPDPRNVDPHRFPWVAALVALVALAALLFGGTRFVEAGWGLEVALAYQLCACVGWLLAVACWLVYGTGRRR